MVLYLTFGSLSLDFLLQKFLESQKHKAIQDNTRWRMNLNEIKAIQVEIHGPVSKDLKATSRHPFWSKNKTKKE